MRSRIWWGILLVVLGLALVLDNIGVLGLREVFHEWWPALLIVIGFAMLIRRRTPVRPIAPRPADLPATWDPRQKPTGESSENRGT